MAFLFVCYHRFIFSISTNTDFFSHSLSLSLAPSKYLSSLSILRVDVDHLTTTTTLFNVTFSQNC